MANIIENLKDLHWKGAGTPLIAKDSRFVLVWMQSNHYVTHRLNLVPRKAMITIQNHPLAAIVPKHLQRIRRVHR